MRTPAKINLFLEILGPRSDGFHNIRSIFLPIFSLFDTVEVYPSPAQGIELSVSGFPVSSNSDNLCSRAAYLFCEYFQLQPAYKIILHKNIPIASGLGGGSSDAAAVLLSLLSLEKQGLDYKALYPLAEQLGSDVSFFLKPQFALCEGRGEIISPINDKIDLELFLLNPSFPIPVQWAYKNRKKADTEQADIADMIAAIKENNPEKIAEACRNDLEIAIFEKYPILQIIREELLQAGCYNVNISGSGPTLFAICKKNNAKNIKNIVEEKFPFAWSFY